MLSTDHLNELSTHKLAAIESLRGVAALLVLVFHLAELLKLTVPEEFGFIRTHFGLGVPLFYTLSGFVLTYGYVKNIGYEKNAVISFYLRRIFRIAPLFYFMLIAWLFIDWYLWSKTFSLEILFLNLIFFFGLVPGEHESIVWAGWSIGIEMLFYLFFPITTILVRGKRGSIIAFFIACFLSAATNHALQNASIGSYAYMNLVTHLPFFMAGIVCYYTWSENKFAKHWIGWVLFLGVFPASAWLTSEKTYLLLTNIHFGAIERNAWAIVFCMLILSACLVTNPILERGPLHRLGKLSFSVYLTHPMIMLALIKMDINKYLGMLTENHVLHFFMGAGFSIGIVWVVSELTFRFIETPGMKIGRQVVARFDHSPARRGPN